MKKRLASMIVMVMLALSTPAQAHENIFSMILKFHNMVHALEQLDKEDIEYAIEQSIKKGLKEYEQQKQFEKSQENSGKLI